MEEDYRNLYRLLLGSPPSNDLNYNISNKFGIRDLQVM